MRNKPGISWGYDDHINLMRSSIGWLAVYYDDVDSAGEIIRVFNPKNYAQYLHMMEKLAFYNYNTCALCQIVKAEMDYG